MLSGWILEFLWISDRLPDPTLRFWWKCLQWLSKSVSPLYISSGGDETSPQFSGLQVENLLKRLYLTKCPWGASSVSTLDLDEKILTREWDWFWNGILQGFQRKAKALIACGEYEFLSADWKFLFPVFRHSKTSGPLSSFSILLVLHKEVNLCTFPVKLGRLSGLPLRREWNESHAVWFLRQGPQNDNGFNLGFSLLGCLPWACSHSVSKKPRPWREPFWPAASAAFLTDTPHPHPDACASKASGDCRLQSTGPSQLILKRL